MRKMTLKQAVNFIKAGYYPKDNEMEAICDLQDVFGHLPYRFVTEEIVFNDELKENGEALLRRMYPKEDVDYYVNRANEMREMIVKASEMEAEIARMQKQLERMKGKIKCYGFNETMQQEYDEEKEEEANA